MRAVRTLSASQSMIARLSQIAMRWPVASVCHSVGTFDDGSSPFELPASHSGVSIGSTTVSNSNPEALQASQPRSDQLL